MAKDNDNAKTNPDPPAPPPESEAPKFSIERLRQDCAELFKISVSTYDGATYGKQGDYTVEEMRGVIDKWLNSPVCTGARKEKK